MANEHQFRTQTRFVAVRGVAEYRQTVPALVEPDDSVLEIGCEWGTTSAVLASHCRSVVATDISLKCIRHARQLHPDIRFEVLDAFDVRAALEMGTEFSKIYVDMSGLSGYRSLLDTIALITAYAAVFRPKAMIVKSGALKHFASGCTAWRATVERPDLSEVSPTRLQQP